MRKINIFSVFVVVLLSATMLSAQGATRTWVSGVGDDANPCSRTAPCKTWAGAISKTTVGGEIDALDPGGFGALTITKSITLDGGGGQVASVLVAGTNGITVSGPGAVVVLRNLRLDGLLGNGANSGNAGLTGISFLQGTSLVIENAYITGFNTSGISANLSAAATLTITNTTIENIGTCAPASCAAGQGDGIYATSSSGTAKVEINNTTVTGFSNNGVEAGAHSIVGFDNGAITNGFNGVTADATGTAIVSHSAVAYNTGTAYNGAGGTVAAYARGTANAANGTNRVHDNGATGIAIYITEN